MKNVGMRMATVTPLGAFPLIDYVIATSQNVGEGLTRLARYLPRRARSVPCLREDEEPIRVLLERCPIVTLGRVHRDTQPAALSRGNWRPVSRRLRELLPHSG